MFEAACEYFQWCDDNPWQKNEALKGGEMAGEIIQVPTQRPYTLQGLCHYLDCNTDYFTNFSKDCSDDFSRVITHMKEIIYRQKFEGASVGAFNANIIARDLGLAEKSTLEASVGVVWNEERTYDKA